MAPLNLSLRKYRLCLLILTLTMYANPIASFALKNTVPSFATTTTTTLHTSKPKGPRKKSTPPPSPSKNPFKTDEEKFNSIEWSNAKFAPGETSVFDAGHFDAAPVGKRVFDSSPGARYMFSFPLLFHLPPPSTSPLFPLLLKF